MTWTFDEEDISTNLAKVRVTIGDTDSDEELLSDEIINFRLTQASDNVKVAAIACVRDILAKLSRKTDRTGTGFSASRSQKFEQYSALLKELTGDATLVATATLTGGSISERENLRDDDDDYEYPAFYRGLHDNESGGTQNTGD